MRWLKLLILCFFCVCFQATADEPYSAWPTAIDEIELGMRKSEVDEIQRGKGREPIDHFGVIWYSGGGIIEGRNLGPRVSFDEEERVVRIVGTSIALGESSLKFDEPAERLFKILGPPDAEEAVPARRIRVVYYKRKRLVVRIGLQDGLPRLKSFNLGDEPRDLKTDF